MIAPFKPRDPRIVLLLLLGAGLALLILNAGLPLVRHSMVYVKAASRVIDGAVTLRELLADPNAHAYEKPLGEVLGFTAFIAALGYRVGPLAHSWVTTALFALAALALLRRLGRRLGIPGDRLGAMLAVTFLNPLAIYQFWAVGPDALFCAAFLAAFALLDDLVGAPDGAGPPGTLARTRLLFGAYLACLYATVAIKFYGVVSIPLHLLYAFALTRGRRPSPRAVAPFLAPLALVACAMAIYPLRQIVGTSDFSAYVETATGIGGSGPGGARPEGGRLATFVGNAAMVAVYLLLSLNALVVCLARRYRRAELPILAVVAIFAGGLMFHDASYYNLRLMLPVSPFLAALVVASPRFASRRLVGTFLAIGTALVLFFNVPNPGAVLMAPGKHERNELSAGRVLKIFDNLRLGARMRVRIMSRMVLDRIPPGAHVVAVSDYYRDAYHGTLELTGFVKPDFHVHYVTSCREVVPPAGSFYLVGADDRCRLPFPCSRETIAPKLERIEVSGARPGAGR